MPDIVADTPLFARTLFRMARALIFDDPADTELGALPMAQLRLLWMVRVHHQAPMKEFSERLDISQSTATQLADRLVRRRLIERIPDLSDRRVVLLQLSDTGNALLDAAQLRRRQNLDTVWERLTPADRAQTIHVFTQLAEHAEAIRVEQGRPLLGVSDSLPEDPDSAEDEQPLVDLMSRNVRGKTNRDAQ